MKLISNLLGMIAAGALGYVAEPHLRQQLTGIDPTAPEIARESPPAPAVATPPAAPVTTPPAPVAPPPAAPAHPTPPAPVSPPPAPPKTDDAILSAIKEHVRSGAIQAFTFDQVKGWTVGEDETVAGVRYQVGFAAYETESAFGTKRDRAKALLKDGKVVRWIDPETGAEIQ